MPGAAAPGMARTQQPSEQALGPAGSPHTHGLTDRSTEAPANSSVTERHRGRRHVADCGECTIVVRAVETGLLCETIPRAHGSVLFAAARARLSAASLRSGAPQKTRLDLSRRCPPLQLSLGALSARPRTRAPHPRKISCGCWVLQSVRKRGPPLALGPRSSRGPWGTRLECWNREQPAPDAALTLAWGEAHEGQVLGSSACSFLRMRVP